MGSKSEFWQSHIAGWRSSGLSQAAYCRQHGLKLKCFTYRRRTQGVPESNGVPAVIPIVMSASVGVDDRMEVHLPNGLQIRMSIGLDPARLVPMIWALWSC